MRELRPLQKSRSTAGLKNLKLFQILPNWPFFVTDEACNEPGGSGDLNPANTQPIPDSGGDPKMQQIICSSHKSVTAFADIQQIVFDPPLWRNARRPLSCASIPKYLQTNTRTPALECAGEKFLATKMSQDGGSVSSRLLLVDGLFS